MARLCQADIERAEMQARSVQSMSYATLMVHVDADAELDGRVRVAANLAERFNAHVIGVAGWAPLSVFLAEEARDEPASSESHLQDMRSLLDQTEKAFRAAVSKVDPLVEWRSVLDFPTEVVAREARAADLVIIGNTRENRDPFRALDPGQLLLKVGRPVLVVPSGVVSLVPRRVAVAWKDVREARRAVRDALPFLQQAENVMLVEVMEEGTVDQAGHHIKDVANYLARHGVEIIAERVRPADVTAANALLRMIEEQNIHLMVAGGYGHSRLGEWAFGGVTRDLLAESPICCLFSH
jgi:nucleotide-binding universal stress UspA family protein